MIDYTADSSAVSIAPGTSSCPSRVETAPEELPPLQARYTIFFDGTGNNLFNTRERVRTRRDRGGSYYNEYSNVARMAQYIQPQGSERNEHIVMYVEGIGTFHGTYDIASGVGSATGMGGTGVVNRVTACINRMISSLNTISRETNRVVNLLSMDVFGFSRGAAAARHFIHRYDNDTAGPTLQYNLNRRGFTINSFRFPFAGLFDTVSAHGIDAEDDTEDLGMTSIARGEVQHIVQLIASEEHRLNFPLTNTRSAGGKCLNINLPGVHSDIGGGYRLREHELDFPVLRLHTGIMTSDEEHLRCRRIVRRDLRWLIERGWYRRSEFDSMSLVVADGDDSQDSTMDYTPLEVRVNRRNISNGYAWIPCIMMSQYAINYGGLQFDAEVTDRARLNSFLNGIYDRIQSNLGADMSYWVNATDEQMNQLRHRYLHFSSHFDTTLGVEAMRPQFVNTSQYGARVYGNTLEDMQVGTRFRRIYDG